MKQALAAFDVKVALASWLRDPRTPETFRKMSMTDSFGFRNAEALPSYVPTLANAMTAAEVFWVNGDMSEVVEAASLSLPDFKVSGAEPPCPDGLVIFSRPLRGTHSATDQDVDRADGFLWTIQQLPPERTDSKAALDRLRALYPGFDPTQENPGIMIIPFALYGPEAAEARSIGMPAFPFPPATYPLGFDATVNLNAIRAMRAFWFLCRQRIASTVRQPLNRGGLRRLGRLDLDVLPEVSVVTLRRPAGHEREDKDGPGFVDWSHRWIVGGHWRNQYLPSEDRHEPRWIAPYIKGPEDKPLVADRVYELTR